MSKKAKLRKKLMSGTNDKSFTFAELTQALAHEGFSLDLGKGSHHVYRHADGRRVVIPRHGKDVKPAYVRLVRESLDYENTKNTEE